ncbi:MAG: aminotransferase class I/II-fold pyridoxal phosphate-dependent enzyme [Bacteroidia bacterium]
MTDFLKQALEQRLQQGLLRKLVVSDGLEDFSSNDYLGFSRLDFPISQKHGSTGSRLISGNAPFTEEVENYLSDFFHQEAALLFNSGYDANVGLFSSVPQKGDTILYDELIHASVRDGVRLSFAKSFHFTHNDLYDLEHKLQNAQGNIFVAVESIYSMDGDAAPLEAIAELCNKHQAHLIVDEAHSGGIFGKHGEGLVSELNLDDKIFAKLITFGKVYGSHGAVVLGRNDLRNYLINFARSFIYTTALPPSTVERIKHVVEYSKHCQEREQLWKNIDAYIELAKQKNRRYNFSPIQIIACKNNEDALQKAELLKQKGLFVKAILSPTVPQGKECLRVCLHSFNDENSLKKLINEN